MSERINLKNYSRSKEWFSIRNYTFNILDHDLRIEGLVNIPVTLYNGSKCEVRLNDKGIEEYRKLYDFEMMAKISLDNTKWFISKAEERSEIFEYIKTEAVAICDRMMTCIKNNDIENNKSRIKIIFEDLHILYSKFVSFAYLGMYDKVLIEMFYSFLKAFYNDEEISSIFNDLFITPNYFFMNLDNPNLGEDKKIKIPYSKEYIPIYGNCNMNYVNVVQKYELDFFHKIKGNYLEIAIQYLAVVPLIFQLGQENIFIGKSIQPIFSILFSQIGYYLDKHKLVSGSESLLNMRYDEIFKLYLNF